ncbi:MAG: DUF2182 domain-containing protein [Pseudomonadota bacterium]
MRRAASVLAHPATGWGAFFVAILIAWAVLLLMAAEHDPAQTLGASGLSSGPLGALSPGYSVELWRALCLTDTGTLSLSSLMGMWAVMSLAMMAPTAVPMLRTYSNVVSNHPKQRFAGFAALVAGYLSVWCLFAIPAAALQWVLASRDAITPHGVSVSLPLTAGLLAIAGLYQFTSMKEACVKKCRSPMAFFMSHWRDGIGGAYRMGLRHGADCVGCCWALMLLGFVGGTMNPIWMAGAMVLMIVEKLPQIGRHVTVPLGLVLLVAAGYVAAQGLV